MTDAYPDDRIDNFADMVGAWVAGGQSLDSVRSYLRITKTPDDLIELAIARFEMRMSDINGVEVVVDPEGDHTAWYAGPKAADRFWPPVKAALQQRLPAGAVTDVDKVTSLTLSKLHAPGTAQFSDRGLVLGYVQSGKTTNFMALAAKAADAGYKLIVVLSGVTDSLRDQTQERVDEVLVGDSADWFPLTKRGDDFAHSTGARALFTKFNGALIAVVKKNPARLRRLRDWMTGAGKIAMEHAPLLLIDDEADQASINVGDAARASTINALLRDILKHPRSAYVAYTATPFANLLIDPRNESDLYPRDLIVSMPKPAGYFGPERLFGNIDLPDDAGLDMIRTIPAGEAVSARPPAGLGAVNTWNPVLGSELRRSILWFILSTAAKRQRNGNGQHSTMLIHTSMLSEAHFRTRDIVSAALDAIRVGIATDDVGVINELHEVWVAESTRVPASRFDHASLEWDDLLPALRGTADDIDIVVDNYKSRDRLSYASITPTTAIVIGGNTLSRGLTLEGLTASYFVRSASAYDTLLQMGRWFGYRSGYEDLCRIWMTDELRRWFRDLSRVEQEIRDEIARYRREGLSPLELGVRIRLHPDLAITEASKMQNAVNASLSYSGRNPQTTVFRRHDSERLDRNIRAAKHLLETIQRHGGAVEEFAAGGSLNQLLRGFRDVPAEYILRFLAEYEFDEDQREMTRELLSTYIRDELKNGSLEKWRAVVMEGPSGEKIELPGVGQVGTVVRSRIANTDDDIANIRILTSAEDRVAGIDWESDETPPKGADLLVERSKRHPKEGILRLYLIDRTSAPKAGSQTRAALDAAGIVTGISVDFPESSTPDQSIGYVIAAVPGAEDVEEAEAASAADDADEKELDDTDEA
ncbi:Z1 domain-containing protein [Microbacterium rhizosphaerae]|uniref:Z1 domain-containing protein n=1 Tax=Microbacterium rhizosphaerae TaxID=1678237 RepID=A0ABZ0SR76_9MICO|nr:Z1 domain-containing protein [Microbacterium rhizosphaerae]WPR91479.1 Z1 domain-containing protein [Microbacterium rhizosphaerae]